MKNKFLIIILLIVGVLSSCTSKFEEYNKDTKNPKDVPGNYVFTHAEYLMSYHLSLANVNVGIFNLMAQYITETTYTDEANWDLANRRIPDNFSRRMYYDLNELKIAKELIEKEVAGEGPVAEKKNRQLIIDILQAYLWQVLVDIFGDIPYTDALNPNNTLPKYDNDAEVYADLIKKVKAAYDGLNENFGSFGDADLIYHGDVASWKKFAAGLLVKLAVTSWDANASVSQQIVEQYYDKTYTSLSEGAYFPFQQTSPYQNPIYEDFVASGRKDFVVCHTLLSQMQNNDPRLDFYGKDYVRDTISNEITNGGIYGANNNFATCAHLSAKILAPDFNGFLLTYDEILFYLAEAAAKGANVGKTAAELYAAAVTASFEYWTGSAGNATPYLVLRPYVDIKSIAKEEWIAMYMRGLIGWTTYRRIDGAFNLVVPDGNTPNLTVVPTRFFYPINEQTLNKTNWSAAAAAMGGDLLTSKIFWDVH